MRTNQVSPISRAADDRPDEKSCSTGRTWPVGTSAMLRATMGLNCPSAGCAVWPPPASHWPTTTAREAGWVY
eukprot:1977513-Alexandrium_andersonii.AAC.1